MARQIGYTEREIEALDRAARAEEFDPALRAMLEYASAMTVDAHRVTREMFDGLKRHFTDAEIVEITCVVGLANYWNRFSSALRVDLSGTDEPYDPSEPSAG